MLLILIMLVSMCGIGYCGCLALHFESNKAAIIMGVLVFVLFIAANAYVCR